MLARVHNRRPQGAEVFRPQKSSIAVVRLRSVLRVREDGSRTGSAILWLKSDGSSPTLTETRAHKPTIHAFRDRVLHNRISRKLPPRTTRTYKIPNASPKGMHPHEQYKNVPNKKQTELKRKRYKLPTTLNTTAKDKAQNAAQQRLIKTP